MSSTLKFLDTELYKWSSDTTTLLFGGVTFPRLRVWVSRRLKIPNMWVANKHQNNASLRWIAELFGFEQPSGTGNPRLAVIDVTLSAAV